jgi:predicted enzyme related to lactoylglutathione lyase
MNNVENIVYTVSDIGTATAIHTALLGVEPHTEQPCYVGFDVGGFEIGLTPQARGASVGAVAHILVADLEAALAEAQQAGATVASEPRQVAPSTRVASVTDPDGITLGLIEHTPNES